MKARAKPEHELSFNPLFLHDFFSFRSRQHLRFGVFIGLAIALRLAAS